MIPKYIFFTKGVGRHKDYLQSFELALRDAGIEKCNIVSVSSIYPPGCKKITKEEGVRMLSPGQITFAVVARNATNEPNRLIASSIGVAIPADQTQYGYLSEHHPFGETADKAGDYAEDLAASMLASTLGVEFDANAAWSEKEQTFKMAKEIVRTFNITQTAQGHKDGLWTTTVAAAVLLPADTLENQAKVSLDISTANVLDAIGKASISSRPSKLPPDAPVQITCGKPLDIEY